MAFHITGRRSGTGLQPMDKRYRPALLARYGDLAALRYDFPLVLNQHGSPERAILSLSRLVDDAIAQLADAPERDRIARHAYNIEREVRRGLLSGGTADFEHLWHAAARRVAVDRDEGVLKSAERLWAMFDATGELADVTAAMPFRVIRHAWQAIQAEKTRAFGRRVERLLLKLHEILRAEEVGSAEGWKPQRLRSSVGSAFANAFDFDRLSNILVETKPRADLSPQRRARVRRLIDALERQRFYALGASQTERYEFAFLRCADALNAYQERHAHAVELIRALAVAELEVHGDYRESVHDTMFDGFGSNGLNAAQLGQLPDYLVCASAGTLDAEELCRVNELIAAGLPVKVLVQTDDCLEPSKIAEGHVALGLRARQLVDTAIGLTDAFVVQASASQLYRTRAALMRGLAYEGSTMISVFSGANEHTAEIPAYLVAAAATESRVFPSLTYDPSAGTNWASRLSVQDNPSLSDDWPTYDFSYEDANAQVYKESLAFTLADFMAMDDRFHHHFAIMPRSEWNDAVIPISQAMGGEERGARGRVPSITLVDADGRLHRALCDDRTLLETRRCRTMWHSLQELGGIHNSHAERVRAQPCKVDVEPRAVAIEIAATPAPIAAEPIASAPLPTASAAVVGNGHAVKEVPSDAPYIETARCTSCNECVQRNAKMFAYNENKQAYIADPDAGTFRQLVEAAEGCQVSIIHPGKPRNPKEPGLEELLQRAASFN